MQNGVKFPGISAGIVLKTYSREFPVALFNILYFYFFAFYFFHSHSVTIVLSFCYCDIFAVMHVRVLFNLANVCCFGFTQLTRHIFSYGQLSTIRFCHSGARPPSGIPESPSGIPGNMSLEKLPRKFCSVLHLIFYILKFRVLIIMCSHSTWKT